MTDEQIEQAHLQANQELRCLISQWRHRKEELEQDLANLIRWESIVRKAVEKGQWWVLEDFISEELIEVPCECEPTDRLSIIDEDWSE